MQTIRDTIPHVKGIEELINASFDPNQQFLACMVGKAHQEIRLYDLENMHSCHLNKSTWT